MLTDSHEDLRRWRLPRGRHGLPRELVARSQRERLLAAVVRVTARKGYAATTVGDVLAEAGVGRESFYELFDDKLDCMLAAHTILTDHLESQIRLAYASSGTWPERVVRALGTALEWFAADPEAARFTLIELTTVGPAFRTRFQDDFKRFVDLLEVTVPGDGPTPAIDSASSLAIGATVAKVYQAVISNRAAELPELLPDLAYEFLVPFIGESAAREQQRLAAD